MSEIEIRFKKKKISKIQKVEMQPIECMNCKYAVIIDNIAICTKKLETYTVKAPNIYPTNHRCLIGEKGEPYKDIIAQYKLLDLYIYVDNQLKELMYIRDRLNRLIKENIPEGRYHLKGYTLIVGKFKKKILDTETVKAILKKIGKLSDAEKEIEVKYVKVKRSRR